MADSRVSVLLDFNSRLAGANQALTAMKNLAGTLAAGATAYLSFRTAIRGGRDLIELGAKLQHVNDQTGIAVRSLSVFGQAFEDAGISAEKVRTSVSMMQKNIVDGARGTGEGLVAFTQLAIDARDLLDLAPEDQFKRIGDAIARIEDPAIRANASMKIFGEAGAELQGVFAGGFEDAELSLGRLPELMERNAAALERISTLTDRTRNKSRQFFAGFLDQTEQYIRKPLEDLDKLDLSGIGQRLGALAGIAIDAWNDGNFPAFMALSIEAGVEKGIESAKSIFEGLVGIVSGAGFWANLTNLFASFGVAIGKAFIDAMGEVTALFDATLTWMLQEVKKLAIELRIQAERLPIILSGNARALTAFDSAAEVVRKMTDAGRDFSIIWDESRRTFNETAQAGNDFLDEQLRLTREILGVNQANNDANLTAAERLNQLIQERIDARGAVVVSGGVGAGGNSQGPAGNRGLNPNSWSDQLAAGLNSLPTLAQSAGDAVRTSLGGAVSSVATGLDGLFQRSMTLGQALQNIATGFGQAITGALSRMLAEWTVSLAVMGAKYAASKAAMFAVDVLYSAKSLALNLAAAAKSLVSWIPAAIASSIASFGVAGAVGLAAVVAALAAFGAFEQGGYTGDGPSNAVAGIVHRGEYVVPASAVSRIGVNNLSSMTAAASRGFRDGGSTGGSFGGSSNNQPINIHIAQVRDEREAMNWLASREGRKIIYRGLRDGQGSDGWTPS